MSLPALAFATSLVQPLLVVFVAVISGTDRTAVEQYTQAVGVTWPVIIDRDPKFEAQWRDLWGGSEISLSNIHQIAFLGKDGRPLKGQWEDIAGSAKRALEGRSVPKQVPGTLRSCLETGPVRSVHQ